MTAISATFCEIKQIKSRKVVQLVFEIPIEAGNEALRVLGGLPNPESEQWVGIAPLTEQPTEAPSEKAHRAWADLPPAEQAGILCNDPDFWEWLQVSENSNGHVVTADWHAANCLRRRLLIDSRAHLNTDEAAADRFRNMAHEFFDWKSK